MLGKMIRSALGGRDERANLLQGRSALVDYRKLQAMAEYCADSYATADPFPHIVLDEFLDPEVANAAIDDFPSPEMLAWVRRDAIADDGCEVQSNKLDFALGRKDLDSELKLAPLLRYLLLELNSATFLRFLQRLTGISGLIADPGMWGGGLHQSLRGGRLAVHADFLRHPTYQFERRLNVLLFLNRNWRETYGGELELWSRDMRRCVKKVAPIANRCVIFTTSAVSYHGYSHPITCPENVTRKSIALYYYTVPIGTERIRPVTYWQRPAFDEDQR